MKIIADQDLKVLAWQEAEIKKELTMDGKTGQLKIKVNDTEYVISVTAEEYVATPSLGEKIAHVFGWKKNVADDNTSTTPSESSDVKEEEPEVEVETFKINTAVENGTIDETQEVKKGENIEIKYEPLDGYLINKIVIDDKEYSYDDIRDNKWLESYSFDEVSSEHTIKVIYTKIENPETGIFTGLTLLIVTGMITFGIYQNIKKKNYISKI